VLVCAGLNYLCGVMGVDYKYTVIISQYYHSRHSFIVKFDADKFKEQAKKVVAELEQYKRDAGCTRDIDLGDLVYKDTDEIYSRYNINDYGDIYFLNCFTVNGCAQNVTEYREVSNRESRGYKRKAVISAIEEHHNYSQVKKIVEKYFEVA